MTRALADRISARRASDRLAALNPFIQPDAGASVAPVEISSTDEPLIAEGSAGAANSACRASTATAVPLAVDDRATGPRGVPDKTDHATHSDDLDIPAFLDRRLKQ